MIASTVAIAGIVSTSAAGTAVAYHVASEALNLYGEEFLEMHVYFEKNVITSMQASETEDAIQLFVEFTSSIGATGKNGIRMIIYDTFFLSQGVVPG